MYNSYVVCLFLLAHSQSLCESESMTKPRQSEYFVGRNVYPGNHAISPVSVLSVPSFLAGPRPRSVGSMPLPLSVCHSAIRSGTVLSTPSGHAFLSDDSFAHNRTRSGTGSREASSLAGPELEHRKHTSRHMLWRQTSKTRGAVKTPCCLPFCFRITFG